MKTRLLIIIGIITLSGFTSVVFAEESQDVMLTQFDVYISDDDFTTQGPNHNIMILDRGNSTTINVHVKNNDDVPHKIRLHSPTDSDSATFSMFKFDPEEILVLPNEINSTKLYMTVANNTDTHTTFVTFLGQSNTFGMKGLGFYLVVGDDFVQWTDYSLRAGLPGVAFPYLDTDISEDAAEKIITNGLGAPTYTPQSYKFRGMTDWGHSQQFVYSPLSVTISTEMIQFWKDNNMMIFYGNDGPNVNNTKSLPFKVAQDEGQQVMINGLMGSVTEQTSRTVMESDLTYKVPADLHFFDDNEKFSVSIKANMPLDEILKVASSIPKLSSNQHKQELTDSMKIDNTGDYPPVRSDMSPLKQFKSGISIDEIQCKESLTIVTKNDGSPACVTPETAEKLIQRGWADNSTTTSTIKKQTEAVFSDPVLAKKITESNNQFTLDFYKQISKEKNENIFFSSPSISTAFSILYEGAKGDTAAEIQDIFGFSTNDYERQLGFVSFINMMNQKNNDENTIQMSNALWLANGFTPLPEYINTAITYYDSSIDTVNFATDEGRLEINDWVKSKTQDRIEELLVPGSITSLTKMVITNTIYFKGLWEYPFELKNTYDDDFVVNPTNTVTVPMMTYDHKMDLNYTSTDQMQMLQMPYTGNSFSMLIILPHDTVNMQSVEDSLTIDNLELWKSQLIDLRGINIHIPKFTLDTEYNLKKILPDMGVSLVFGPADLSDITGYRGLFVSEAVHKAFVEVNELGTEAAAATAINLNESGGVLFKADHPFIFLTQDNITNDILFIGKIVDPTK